MSSRSRVLSHNPVALELQVGEECPHTSFALTAFCCQHNFNTCNIKIYILSKQNATYTRIINNTYACVRMRTHTQLLCLCSTASCLLTYSSSSCLFVHLFWDCVFVSSFLIYCRLSSFRPSRIRLLKMCTLLWRQCCNGFRH